MAVIKKKHKENPFVMIDKSFFEDETLSWKAKGLMGYLLSRPEDWTIRKADLINRSKDGEQVVETTLIELMIHGYIYFYQEREKDGTFGEWIYLVFETPEDNPYLEKSIERGKEMEAKRKAKNRKNNSSLLQKQPKGDNPEADNPEADNHPLTNNEFKEEEEEEVFHLFQENIGPLKSAVRKKINAWIKRLPIGVIKAEIENAAIYGAKSWAYVEKSLIEDEKLGIKSTNEVLAKIENHSKSSKKQRLEPMKELSQRDINRSDSSFNFQERKKMYFEAQKKQAAANK